MLAGPLAYSVVFASVSISHPVFLLVGVVVLELKLVVGLVAVVAVV